MNSRLRLHLQCPVFTSFKSVFADDVTGLFKFLLFAVHHFVFLKYFVFIRLNVAGHVGLLQDVMNLKIYFVTFRILIIHRLAGLCGLELFVYSDCNGRDYLHKYLFTYMCIYVYSLINVLILLSKIHFIQVFCFSFSIYLIF